MRWRVPDIIKTAISFAIIGATAPIWVPAVVILIPVFFAWNWIEKRTAPSREWHDWYAWRPVRFNSWDDDDAYDKIVWLEKVRRRRRHSYIEYGPLEQREIYE